MGQVHLVQDGAQPPPLGTSPALHYPPSLPVSGTRVGGKGRAYPRGLLCSSGGTLPGRVSAYWKIQHPAGHHSEIMISNKGDYEDLFSTPCGENRLFWKKNGTYLVTNSKRNSSFLYYQKNEKRTKIKCLIQMMLSFYKDITKATGEKRLNIINDT